MAARPAVERPNIATIVADDLGHGELACEGAGDLRTPHIDALAHEGVRLTHYYTASPVCTPARAALLTGQHPLRLGVNRVLRKEDDDTGLPRDVKTIAELLKARDYATGLCGKWHLGMAPHCHPMARGFDRFYGVLNGMIDYHTHISLGGGGDGGHHFYDNQTRITADGYFTELVTQQACDFVDAHHDQPFYLAVTYTAPHTPLQATEHWLKRMSHLPEGDRRTYAAMVACMDDGIGRICARLAAHDIARDTIVIFTSDHGWADRDATRSASANGGLRRGKYTLYEGGLRVPCIVRWPAMLPAGATCDQAIVGMDLPRTLSRWAGTNDEASDACVDGIDVTDALRNGTALPPRDLHWQYGPDDRAKAPAQLAIQRDRWKLVITGQHCELFDIISDPREANCIAAQQPALVCDMREAAREWETQMRDAATELK